MLSNTIIGNSPQGKLGDNADIEVYISNALGLEARATASLAGAFRQGMKPIVLGLKKGDLTEQQASLLIELLLAGYIGATINDHIDSAFRSWAERVSVAHLGEKRERR